jgi:hypothetical protein
LVVLDLSSGRRLWSRGLAAPPTAPPLVWDKVVYVGTRHSLTAHHLVDGSVMFGLELPEGGPAGDLQTIGDQLIWVSARGKLVVVDRHQGKVLAAHEGAVPGAPPLPVRGKLFYFAQEGLMQLATDQLDAPPAPWADTSWLGPPATPLVLHRSKLYAGLGGWGLVCFGASR